MDGINFSQFWKIFVSDFIDVQRGIITVMDEANDYHPIVLRSICKLGWTFERDLFHHKAFGRKNERPDFFIEYDGNRGIPVEVKLPNNAMNEENKEQLIEYMRLSDSNIGIYIGESVRVFYRPSLEKELKIILDAAFVEEDIEGIVFAELFFNGTFDFELLKRRLNNYYELERLIDEKKLSEIQERINEPVSEKWLADRFAKRTNLQLPRHLVDIGKKKNYKTQGDKSLQNSTKTLVHENLKSEDCSQVVIYLPLTIKDVIDNGVKQLKRQGFPKEKSTLKYASRLWLLKGLLQDGLITEEQFKEASELPSIYGWKKQDRKNEVID